MSVTMGFLGGVGVLAMTLQGDVRAHEVVIEQHDKRLTNANELMRASIEQTTKLVATVEVQNKLIIDQNQRLNQSRTQ